ncbi:MFS transporter [Sphaerisporangium siamense]|uniref:MFS family permease n=1 Tax=Sphaerisporangium siamense TaxID=795645 RepID=A0A7W7D6P8_9ACTN|nr:MFS transporter [Sphaerisporangium siamense]MBB4701309.1 MFS family permease [Sphaerisporangium siamense]GII87323.1 MFS transporter [Sphaerisporangium siamense]
MTVTGRPAHRPPARAYALFAGADAISQVGTQVGVVALPLAAVLLLHAGPMQVGLLATAQMLAFLVIGLPAGVWVDRLPRRRVLVVADLVRAAVLVSVPVAAAAGVLGMPQLYAVALVGGVCTVFFDVAHMSYLPSIVARDALARANGTIETIRSAAALAGPGAGGWLVQVVTAPVALLADAISFALSAALLGGIPVRGEPPVRTERAGLRRELAEGVRYVAGHPVLRVVAMVGALAMLSNGIWAASQTLYLIDVLGLGPGAYGLVVAAGAVGGVVGGLTAPRATARWGTGRTMWGSAAVALLVAPIAPLASPGWQVALFPLGLALGGLAGGVFNVAQLTYRQSTCPEHLLGRMNAGMRFLMWSAMPFGGLAGGFVGERYGVVTALWAAALTTGLAHLPVLLARRRVLSL